MKLLNAEYNTVQALKALIISGIAGGATMGLISSAGATSPTIVALTHAIEAIAKAIELSHELQLAFDSVEKSLTVLTNVVEDASSPNHDNSFKDEIPFKERLQAMLKQPDSASPDHGPSPLSNSPS